MKKDFEREKRGKELQSRREFFKRISIKTLPFLGAVVLGPTISLTTLTSCGCEGCEATCMDNCEGGCDGSCQGSATGALCSDCSSTCNGNSTESTCSSCANSCSSSCKETCKEACKNTCANTCEGSAQGQPTTGSIDGHEYVDLGLSVLWATCNIGANNVEEYGEFFAFADPTGQNVLSVHDKEYHDQIHLEVGQCISETKYDAARHKWGGKWKLPTADECRELIANCILKYYKTGNDVNYELTSKLNGNKIIMPGAGFSYNKDYSNRDDWYYDIGEGIYWSGNVEEYSRGTTLFLEWDEARVSSNGYGMPYRDLLPIRPVTNRSNGNSSTCNGSCTANCSSDCTATCKNECKSGCIGDCGNNCTGGCKEKCTITCADSCSSDCSGRCTRTCADNCYSNCDSGCTTTCADACKAQTSQGCSDCSSDCSSSCGGSCERDCTGNCGMQCAETCGGNCSRDCIGQCSRECRGGAYANTSWCAGCVYSCDSYCANTCSFYCYTSCQNNGRKG